MLVCPSCPGAVVLFVAIAASRSRSSRRGYNGIDDGNDDGHDHGDDDLLIVIMIATMMMMLKREIY